MPAILHILTRAEDSLARRVISLQSQPGVNVVTVDLTRPDPDYADLLEKIFKADSVEVW